jgi:hypothetical protein
MLKTSTQMRRLRTYNQERRGCVGCNCTAQHHQQSNDAADLSPREASSHRHCAPGRRTRRQSATVCLNWTEHNESVTGTHNGLVRGGDAKQLQQQLWLSCTHCRPLDGQQRMGVAAVGNEDFSSLSSALAPLPFHDRRHDPTWWTGLSKMCAEDSRWEVMAGRRRSDFLLGSWR